MFAGTRVPSPNLLARISEAIGAEPHVISELIKSAGDFQRKRGLKRMHPTYRKSKSADTSSVRDLSIDFYRVIADWYHSAILELTFVESFKPNFKWIAKAIGISEAEAKLGVHRLCELGLLESKKGKLSKTSGPTTTANKDVTTPALRKHQRDLLEKAISSLDQDPIEERDMTGMTMAIDPKLLPEAKRRVQVFTKDLTEFLESGSRTRLYQMQISLFPIQIREKKGNQND